MAGKGRSRTPTGILKLRGSWLAKTRKDEPISDGSPDRPDCIEAAAIALWDKLVPIFEAMGILGRVDGPTLQRYCRLAAQFDVAAQFVEQNGMTYIGPEGHELYPQTNVMLKISEQLLRMEAKFGMTPSDRAGMAVTKKAGDAGKSKYFAKGG